MFEELENKVVLVTGAATGIGKSIAENFGKAKAKVVINYRSDRHHDEIEEIKQTVAKFGGQTLVVQGDVSIEEDIKRMISSHTATCSHHLSKPTCLMFNKRYSFFNHILLILCMC